VETSKSPYFELHQALKNNPIRLAEEMTTTENLDDYVQKRLDEGGWITVQSNEVVEISRQNGWCNLVYMEVSLVLKMCEYELLFSIKRNAFLFVRHRNFHYDNNAN
jgi:hypothetical protein